MSKYSVNQTVLREEKYLVEALKEMGYEVEVHPEGAQLNSYYAEQEAKAANIIIRRQHLRGAYGDIGFTRQPDGQFAMVKDELDEYRGYGAKWLGPCSAALQGEADLGHGRRQGLHPERPGSDPDQGRPAGAAAVCRTEVSHHAGEDHHDHD